MGVTGTARALYCLQNGRTDAIALLRAKESVFLLFSPGAIGIVARPAKKVARLASFLAGLAGFAQILCKSREKPACFSNTPSRLC